MSTESQPKVEGYSNEATWEAAVTLANSAQILADVDKLRDAGGLVTGQQLQRHFTDAKLKKLNVRAPSGAVNWDEVALDLNPDAYELAHRAGVPVAEQAAIKLRLIDEDAMAVLHRCTADETGVRLPAGQLDRKLYAKVDAVLKELGGKWVSKLKCHKFADEDPIAMLSAVQATGAYVSSKDFGFFPTPPAVAAKAIAAAGLRPGMLLLEPSAGMGGLLDHAAPVVGMENVVAVELLPKNIDTLTRKGYPVLAGDFLAMTPEPIFDVVVMNPPFDRLSDVAHVQHAARFLKPTGKLVSIMSPSFTFNSAKKAQAFRDLMEQAGELVEEIEEGAFKSSGTNVRTVIVALDAAKLPWNQVHAVKECDTQAANEQVADVQVGSEDDEAPARERHAA